MVEDAFQRPEEAMGLEDRVQDIILGAFTMADDVHVDCAGDSNFDHNVDNTGLGKPIGDRGTTNVAEDHRFDPQALEEAIQPLY